MFLKRSSPKALPTPSSTIHNKLGDIQLCQKRTMRKISFNEIRNGCNGVIILDFNDGTHTEKSEVLAF